MNPSAAFARIVSLEPDGPGRYVGPPSPEGSGRTFGGQFLAQGLAAAQQLEHGGRAVHSLHGYFVRPGVVDEPTVFVVTTIREGRSFALRSVTASQHGDVVFELLTSFHVTEDGFDYQPGQRYPMDEVPPPDPSMMTYAGFTYAHPDTPAGQWEGEQRPIDIYYLNPPVGPEGPAVVEPQLMWIRIPGSLPEDPAIHAAGVAYLSDSTLIDHVMLPHGYRWQDDRLTGASLDHAMWFHRPTRADEWLLFDQRVESTSGARGLVTGRLYRPDGALVATCTQEGLMRWRQDRGR